LNKNRPFFGSESKIKDIETNGKDFGDIMYPVANESEFFKEFPIQLPMYCNPNDSEYRKWTDLEENLGLPFDYKKYDVLGNVRENVKRSQYINMEAETDQSQLSLQELLDEIQNIIQSQNL
jgi:hypothetical protein